MVQNWKLNRYFEKYKNINVIIKEIRDNVRNHKNWEIQIPKM